MFESTPMGAIDDGETTGTRMLFLILVLLAVVHASRSIDGGWSVRELVVPACPYDHGLCQVVVIPDVVSTRVVSASFLKQKVGNGRKDCVFGHKECSRLHRSVSCVLIALCVLLPLKALLRERLWLASVSGA